MEIQLKQSSLHSLDVLKESGTLSLKQCLPLIGAWIISLLAPVGLMAVGVIVGLIIDKMIFHLKDAGPASLLGLVVPGLLIGGFYAGWIYVTLKVARQQQVHVLPDLFRPINQMFSAFMVLCLTTIAMGITSALVVVSPILYLKFQLAPYYAVDQGYGPIESMKRSWNATNRILIPLAILDLICFGIFTASAVTFVGPFLVFIVQAVATGIVYVRWVLNDELDEIEMQDD